jgi:hypothetical protein
MLCDGGQKFAVAALLMMFLIKQQGRQKATSRRGREVRHATTQQTSGSK